ncbi:MAG: Tfp pilus assembly protein FimT/FimU [Pirellulaceae bacterium]
MKRSWHAFSLIELLIVVAIVGILIAVAAPLLSSDVPQQLQMAADSVAGDLAYARGLAVANNSSYRTTFNIGSKSYVLQHSGAVNSLNKLPPSPFHTFNVGSTQQTADLAKLPMLAGSVSIAAVQKNPATPSDVTDLEFGPLGNTTRPEATLIWLVSNSSGTKLYISITVNPTTGTVDVGNVQAVTPAGITP